MMTNNKFPNSESKTVQNARSIAKRLHKNQLDKSGVPYIKHVESVVRRLIEIFPDVPDFVIEAAWLHDTLEDCGINVRYLYDKNVSYDAIDIVRELTFNSPDYEGMTYIDKIKTIASHPYVAMIKVSDNLDNSDPSRIVALGSDEMVRKRYAPARQILLNSLRQLHIIDDQQLWELADQYLPEDLQQYKWQRERYLTQDGSAPAQ